MRNLAEKDIIEEYPIETITSWSTHRRLQYFQTAEKRICSVCGAVGSRLILHDVNHIDIYTKNLKLMCLEKTSLLINCHTCLPKMKATYNLKGELEKYTALNKQPEEGDLVCRKTLWNSYIGKKRKVKKKVLGHRKVVMPVNKIEINKVTGELAALIIGRKNSYYALRSLVVLVKR